jgi:hypothetical protein
MAMRAWRKAQVDAVETLHNQSGHVDAGAGQRADVAAGGLGG